MQTDLFGTPQASSVSHAPKADFLHKYRFSVRLDQALVILIALLVVFVLVFSFGVEKGKRFAVAELAAERNKREVMMEEFQRKLFEQSQNQQAETSVIKLNSEVSSQSAEISSLPNVPAIAVAEAIETAEAKSEVAAVNSGPSSPPKGKYTIQMVTLTSKEDVERVIKSIVDAGHQGFLLPSGKYLQVCVESFDSRKKANTLLRQLKEQRIVPPDAYVRFVS